jgi:hypothetical protein
MKKIINKVKRILKRYSPRIKHNLDRNQWKDGKKKFNYEQQIVWTWEETSLYAPDYFQRLKFSVENAFGNVLEIGSGIGNMTRWLSENTNVNRIIAIDGFKEATDKLISLNLQNVEVICSRVDQIKLPVDIKIDTLMLCETIEHLFLEEETTMISLIRKNFSNNTRFIISTPIGYLYDPFHFRYFSKQKFISHIERHYGPIIKIDYSSNYSQVAIGTFQYKR